MPPVDIVIPVYNAVDDLVRCVDSVLACTAPPYRLLLIDDASPESGVARYFDALAARALPQVTLLRNEVNRGFTGTANRGIVHGEREGSDVVLLNSDTVVTRGWLDALLRCAASSPHIGTITPFSNNAEICSFPRFCVDNRWPDDGDAEAVRAALARAAVPTYPELPTGVGFCLFIRRALVEGIGLLDEDAFGRGYGEENDFCLRAFRAGWRNVLCDDAFVLHLGARSFAADKAALAAANLRVLQQRHRHYEAMVADYVARDPIAPLRAAALAQLRLAATAAPGVLHVIHHHGGGTEQHVRSLIAEAPAGLRQHLAVAEGDRWRIEEHGASELLASYALTRQPGESLQEFVGGICASLRIGVIHLHNVSGCGGGLAAALRELGVPYGCTIHDLHWACPTITMLGRDGLYCGGQTDLAVCRGCLAARPEFAAFDIERWRREHGALIADARFVIAPSRWAREMVNRYFPGPDVAMIPHGLPDHAVGACVARADAAPPMAVLLPEDDVPTVAIVGAIGPDKGARRLERLVELARLCAARVRFVVIGYLDVQQAPWRSDDARLTVHGRYDPTELPRLLAHYRARLALYPSAGPESFSYTLSEIWAARLPALVPPFGALAERVGDTGAGWTLTVDEWRSESAMLARVLALVDDADELARSAARSLAAPTSSVAAAAQRTGALYAALPPATTRAAPLSAARIRDALGYRLWWPPEPEPLPATAPPAAARAATPPGALTGLARGVARTRAGVLLRGWLPRSWVDALKARLR